MASTSSITSSGLGSGLDVDTLVTKLISAERSVQDTRLTALTTKTNTQISGLGSLKSAMGSLQTALSALTAGGDLSKRSVTSSSTSILSATAAKTAHTGTTQVEVLSLARAQKLGSAPFGSSTALVGAGAMTFTVGSNSFTVTATATTTVSQLRDAINKASDNVGVSANLVADDTGVRMVLTAANTGTANAVTVGTSLTSFTELQSATDAQIKIDNSYVRTSAYNHIANVTDGVSIDLVSAAIGTKVTLSVSNDDSSATSAIGSFVDSYNTLLSTYATLTAYNSSTQTGGALMGDTSVRTLMQQMRGMLSNSADSGAFSSLSSIGIATDVTGKLSLNSVTLADALVTDTDSIANLFGATTGIATAMNKLVGGYLDADGPIASRLDILDKSLAKIDDDRTELNTKMSKREEQYRNQFNALDSIVSKYKNVASYLDQMDNERYNQKANS
ncbi:MAG: Flagellar hook-associated protein 2 [Hydrocarboniphaga sp.]|uniref:flagellar filament capping protein FliD n=1 Tax=Hydrocarboniphaga sp. TaxID=2033016 RepID=UPI00260BA039|nr:flagellar filament capping protein FliD [Hydrocarboniphaga sp.]MDB5970201.1 Flagellar hook-associated protein 2 [Hydrocarboniphaga sp.]